MRRPWKRFRNPIRLVSNPAGRQGAEDRGRKTEVRGPANLYPFTCNLLPATLFNVQCPSWRTQQPVSRQGAKVRFPHFLDYLP